MRMVPIVIQGIMQSMEMISFNQNPRCLHSLREPHNHNASPLILRNPRPPLRQNFSPSPDLARLSHTKLL